MLIREQRQALTELAAMERRLYELVGAQAAAASDPGEQRRLAVAARRHAWHASLLEQRIPVLHDVAPDAPELPDDAVIARELGRRYDQLRSTATEVSDAPVLRALQLIDLDH